MDENGWRRFVSGCAYAMENGKARQQRNAEATLVETVQRWRTQVLDLAPHRLEDLRRIVDTGVQSPERPPEKD